MRLILVVSNPAAPDEPEVVARLLARLAELAASGKIELVVVTIAGAGGTPRTIAGASRLIQLDDVRGLGSVLSQLTFGYSNQVVLPDPGRRSVDGSDWISADTPAHSAETSSYAVAGAASAAPIALSCGAITAQVALGTDVDYVARLMQRLAQWPATTPRVEPPAPPSLPSSTFSPPSPLDFLAAERQTLEALSHVRRFFDGLGPKVPTAEQLAILIRSDLQTHMILREMCEDLEEALVEPRVVPTDLLRYMRMQDYWRLFDESQERRDRAVALSRVLRDALAAVTEEVQSAKSVR